MCELCVWCVINFSVSYYMSLRSLCPGNRSKNQTLLDFQILISVVLLPVSCVWTKFGKAIVCSVSVFVNLFMAGKGTHTEETVTATLHFLCFFPQS